jgi:hypothetical protein
MPPKPNRLEDRTGVPSPAIRVSNPHGTVLRVQDSLLEARIEMAAVVVVVVVVVVVRGQAETGGDQLAIVIVSLPALGLGSEDLVPRRDEIPAHVLGAVRTRLVTLAVHSRSSLPSAPASATRKIRKERAAPPSQPTWERISHPWSKRLIGIGPERSLDQDEKAVMAKTKSGGRGRIAPSWNRGERSCSFLLERARAEGKNIPRLLLRPRRIRERKRLVRSQRPRRRCISLRRSPLDDWRISLV